MKRLSAALLTAFLLIAAVPLNASADETQNIPANAAGTGNHDSLVAALTHVGLVSTLEGDGPFTVFAPTDAAFAEAGIDLADFDNDEANATLTDILLYHVFAGSVPAANVTDGMVATMVNGDNVTFTVNNGSVMIENANVTTADVMSSNGIIHVIDQVLMPPSDSTDDPAVADFIEVAESTGVHTLLVEALTTTGLDLALDVEGPYTLFAPTDAAFGAIGVDSAFIQNESNNEDLAFVLASHVVDGVVYAANVTDGMSVPVLTEIMLTASVTDGTVSIAGANVTTADVMTSNGIIHVVDAVFDLPTEYEAMAAYLLSAGDTNDDGMITWEEFSAFLTAENDGFEDDEAEAVSMANFNQSDANMDGMLDSDELVVFAELESTTGSASDDDEDMICYNLVSHTIVPGADQATCAAYMYVEDMEMGGMTYTGCYNTVTHAFANLTETECDGFVWTDAVSLAMTAGATGIHVSLVAALNAANLVETISGDDQYTIFAPTDEAFAAAGIDLDAFSTEAEIAALADILLYHVVPGNTKSTDLMEGMTTVTTANGDNLTIHVSAEGGVMVGADMANVTIADIPASNGVIHVIDQVLIPPADEPTVTDPFDGVTCAATVGIGPSGYAFSPSLVNIDVGETVCWTWENESMAHNVKEVDGYQSTTYVENGITSGEAMTTVAFYHTFTEATTFYYACEPHIGLDMFGEVVVGDGGDDVNEVVDDVEESEDTPGFVATTAFLAMVGAVLLAGRRTETTE